MSASTGAGNVTMKSCRLQPMSASTGAGRACVIGPYLNISAKVHVTGMPDWRVSPCIAQHGKSTRGEGWIALIRWRCQSWSHGSRGRLLPRIPRVSERRLDGFAALRSHCRTSHAPASPWQQVHDALSHVALGQAHRGGKDGADWHEQEPYSYGDRRFGLH
eukprot:scaffold119153_cov34-Tisochrysis_lutea.AAC.1